jgi:heptosyltransferase-1
VDHEGPGNVNILIVKLSAIGDVVHTLPALSALRKQYPEAHITWVIEEAASDLIQGHPDLDRVIISRRKRWIGDLRSGGGGDAWKEMREFFRELRGRRYDLVIDFHGLFKSAVIVLLSGGRRKLGYDSMQELSGLFYNEKIPEDMSKHAVNRYLDFACYLGADTGAPEFFLPADEANRTRAGDLLKAAGIVKKGDFIAVSPQALWETKLWADEKFARLCEKIVRGLNRPVVFTGSDATAVERIRALMSVPSVSLAGRTSLRDLACVYRDASLLITTDSGPMHLAAAMDIPVVALFGPTDPKRTGPYGNGHVILRREMPCSPCFAKACDTKRCMREITVDEVYDAVRRKTAEIGVG